MQASKLYSAFAQERVYRHALQEFNHAMHEAEFDAPEGYLISIASLADGAMTEIWDAGKPYKTSYHSVKAGEIRYAPTIRVDSYNGSQLRTSWIRKPIGLRSDAYRDYPHPYIINNGDVELGLISVQDYNEKRANNDTSLFHVPKGVSV